MTPVEEKKSSKRTEESFDFAETSDLCDFGYVLAGPADGRPRGAPAGEHPALEMAAD